DLKRRLAEAEDVRFVKFRHFGWKQPRLEFVSDAKLLFHALLGGEFLVQANDVERDGSLVGKRGDEIEIGFIEGRVGIVLIALVDENEHAEYVAVDGKRRENEVAQGNDFVGRRRHARIMSA